MVLLLASAVTVGLVRKVRSLTASCESDLSTSLKYFRSDSSLVRFFSPRVRADTYAAEAYLPGWVSIMQEFGQPTSETLELDRRADSGLRGVATSLNSQHIRLGKKRSTYLIEHARHEARGHDDSPVREGRVFTHRTAGPRWRPAVPGVRLTCLPHVAWLREKKNAAEGQRSRRDDCQHVEPILPCHF